VRLELQLKDVAVILNI